MLKRLGLIVKLFTFRVLRHIYTFMFATFKTWLTTTSTQRLRLRDPPTPLICYNSVSTRCQTGNNYELFTISHCYSQVIHRWSGANERKSALSGGLDLRCSPGDETCSGGKAD